MRLGGQQGGLHHGVFGITALATIETALAEIHLVSHGEILHPGAHRLHHAGSVTTQDGLFPGHRKALWRLADLAVYGIDTGGPQTHQHLVVARHTRFGTIGQLQFFRPAGTRQDDGFHVGPPVPCSQSCG